MDKSFVMDAAYKQFALDYNCSADSFTKGGVYISERKNNPGRRAFYPEPGSLQLITTGNTMVVMADDKYFDFAEKKLKSLDPAWIFEFPKLAMIEKELCANGERIEDAHQFYLPIVSTEEPKHQECKTEFYDVNGIEQFRGDERFGEAYAFNTRFPDVLGVSAIVDGKIAAMAGASLDCEQLYQIGIGVLPEYRGRGFASYLTWLIKEKLISMNIVPFYGTAESHFASQNVARCAGFFPAWAELVSGEKKLIAENNDK